MIGALVTRNPAKAFGGMRWGDVAGVILSTDYKSPRWCFWYMSTIPINVVCGCCKTIIARMGRLGLENYLGRMEHGGWDSRMTCIVELYE